MNLFTFVFGEKPRPVLDHPPSGVHWRQVRPKPDQALVRARRAEADCSVETGQGVLHARGGLDYIIDYGPNDRAVVRGEIFDATYEPAEGHLYRKRSDVVLRYFTLDYACIVETLEGRQFARPGDWIMQGVRGELWPVPRDKAEAKYDPA